MLNGIKRGVSGIMAQVHRLTHISNNIANATTPGFKRTDGTFKEQLISELDARSIPVDPDGKLETPQGVEFVPEVMFTQGPLVPTGRPWDLAIEGDGFAQLVTSDGQSVYVRGGSFGVDSTGRVVHPSGAFLPGINVPVGVTAVEINTLGEITFATSEGFAAGGTLRLVTFTNIGGLQQGGQGQYLPTENSGAAVPAQGAKVHQGFLEASNVSLTEEMTALIRAQRAYQANVRTVRQLDEMWEKTNALRR